MPTKSSPFAARQAAGLAHESRTDEAATITTSSESELPKGIEFQLTIENVTALRALLKWLLDLLGMEVLMSDALRLHTPVLEREFIKGGAELPMAGYLQRSLLPQMYDGLEHYVLVMQTPNGSVYWEASAYGGAKRWPENGTDRPPLQCGDVPRGPGHRRSLDRIRQERSPTRPASGLPITTRLVELARSSPRLA